MSTPLITIFVRHSADCRYRDDESWKRCRCRKWFRYTHNGVQRREKTGTRSWEDAEKKKRVLEDRLAGRLPTVAPDEGKPLQDAVELFLIDRGAIGTGKSQLSRYKTELLRFRVFCEDQGVFVVHGINRELLTKYAATWATTYEGPNTRVQVRGRLRTFLDYCHQSGWLPISLKPPKTSGEEPETMPLTDAEYQKLLKAVPETLIPMRDRDAEAMETAVKKVHALFRVMRHTGLAVQDALRLQREDLVLDRARKLYRVVTSRTKTGVPVSVLVPKDVSGELLKVQNGNPKYIFWNGTGDPETTVKRWRRDYITPVFKAAGLYDGGHMKTHRLRHTFAVELLEKGVPLEEVAKILGNTIKVCERTYARWIKGRQDRLDNLVTGTWGKG